MHERMLHSPSNMLNQVMLSYASTLFQTSSYFAAAFIPTSKDARVLYLETLFIPFL